MGTSTNRDPARRLSETSSLLGVLEFHPRPAIVLAFLTLAVAVVGWRIFREAGAQRVEALAAEAVGIYEAFPEGGARAAPLPIDPAEKRIFELSSVTVDLPREAPGFVVTGVERATVGKRPAAALRFRHEERFWLLIVFREDRFLGRTAQAELPEESLLSGERDGKSFVYWERDGATFIMVSEADLIQVFRLVRSFFT